MALFIKENGSLQQVSVGHEISKPEQQKSVSLDLASGDQIVTPDNGQVLTQVLIKKPETLVAGNIKNGVNIAGVVGTYTAEDSLKYCVNANNGATPYDFSDNTITYLRQYAFYNDTNIRELKLNAVTNVESNCFKNSSLTKIEMPSLTNMQIGFQSGFSGCADLETANFPNVTIISSNTSSIFYNCTKLKNVDFSSLESCNSYNSNIFSSCTSLQTIDLNKINVIPSGTFGNCTSLTDVTLKATSLVTLRNIDAFSGITPPVTIHVPSSLISSYQSATNWSTLYNDSKVTFVAIQ